MKILIALLLVMLLTSCALLPGGQADPAPGPQPVESSQAAAPPATEGGTSAGPGMGMGPGMMGRHHAAIPAEYAQKTSPYDSDVASIGRGQAIYTQHCATCHGESGMGDGPAGASLDPPASPIAHTSQMLGDNYLFWRLSEGGMPFKTAMPAFKDLLDENQRWDVLHFVRALGQDGAAAIATAQAARQEEMLRQAVEQGVISQAEADTFRTVHDLLEGWMQGQSQTQGSLDEREAAALLRLVQDGKIGQQQVLDFKTIHDKLANAGLMP